MFRDQGKGVWESSMVLTEFVRQALSDTNECRDKEGSGRNCYNT